MDGHLKELAGIKTGCVYKHVRGFNYFIAAVWKKKSFFLFQIKSLSKYMYLVRRILFFKAN